MDFSTHSSLLAAVLCLALAAAVLVRHRVHPTHRAFFLLTLTLAGWNGAYFAYLVALRPMALRVLLLTSFCIPPAAVHFLRRFFYTEMPTLREVRRAAIWTSIALGVATLILPNRPLPLIGTGTLRSLTALSTLYLIAAFVYCTYILQRRQVEEERTVEQTRLRYLRNGAFVVLAALVAETIFAPWALGLHKPRLAAIALTAYAYFIYLSMLNYRLLEIQEILGRAILVGGIGGLLAGFYVLLAKLAGESLGVVYLYALIVSLVILLLYEPVRGYLERRIGRLFFKKSYQLREIVEVLGQEMLRSRSPDELIALLLRELAQLERVTDVSVYLWNPRLGKYAFAGGKGPGVSGLPNAVPQDSIPRVLERTRGPLLRAEIEAHSGAAALSPPAPEAGRLAEQLGELRAELVVPLLSAEHCLGFFAFQDERAIETYAGSEVRLLGSVAGTASVLLENFRASEERGERERLASLGEMAAGLAHEIRNPLSSIKGAVQYLEDEVEVSGKAREFFDVIVEETDRLSRVVSEFLDYSRHPVLRRRPLNVNELVGRIVRQLELDASVPNIEIQTELAPALPLAHADPDRIKQVLINLLQNALAVMPEGGEIRVRTGAGAEGSRPMVWVAVADSGPGMDEATRARIFTPFFTTREGGAGLGLPISHRIVESHGGTMEVRSAPGEGSEFRVLLPVAPVQKLPTAGAAPATGSSTTRDAG